MIQTLISFITASAILAISPGPDNIFVLTQGIVNGKKYGLATVAGLMTGCLVHTTLVAFGVSGIIQQNENIFMLIKLFGAGLFIVFGIQSLSLRCEHQLLNPRNLTAIYIQTIPKRLLDERT